MGLYIESTGKAFDSKFATLIVVAVIVLVTLSTCRNMIESDDTEAPAVVPYMATADLGEVSSWEDLDVDAPDPAINAEPEQEPVLKTEIEFPDRLALEDWAYPPIQGWSHQYEASSYHNGYSAALRATFARFEGQMRAPSTREKIKQIELDILRGYMWRREQTMDVSLGSTEINFVHMAQTVGRFVEYNTQYEDDVDNELKTPWETWTLGGDCEDQALIRYWLLMRLGIPERNLRIVIVDSKGWGRRGTHALLAFLDGDEWGIIDNGAYFPAGQVLSADAFEKVDVISSFNRMGYWDHSKRSINTVEIITPDTKEVCKDVSYRLEHGLMSEAECYGYVPVESELGSPRMDELWVKYGYDHKYFPLGRVGIISAVNWAEPMSRYERQPLTAHARPLPEGEVQFNRGFPRYATQQEYDQLIALALHKALEVAPDDPDLAQAIMARVKVLEAATQWKVNYKVFKMREDIQNIAEEMRVYLQIPKHPERTHTKAVKHWVSVGRRGDESPELVTATLTSGAPETLSMDFEGAAQRLQLALVASKPAEPFDPFQDEVY